MPLTLNSKQSCTSSAKAGFSLTEVLMQLLLLTTVTIPLLMMLDSQRLQLEANRNDLINQLIANQLYDNIIIQHPDLIEAYTAGSVGNNISIHCDPATRLKDSATYTATCTGAGADKNKGPFFRRTLAYTNGNRTVEVTIALYKTATGATPYYQTTRGYILDVVRIDAGSQTTASTIKNPESSDFAQLIATDSAGNLWYPAYYVATLPANIADNLYYITNAGAACTINTIAGSGEAPFTNYFHLSATSCNDGLSFRFPNLSDEETYDVKIYFTADPSSATTCVPDSVDVSCNLADIIIEGYDAAGPTTVILKENTDFDTLAAQGGPGADVKGYIYHAQVTLPNNFEAIHIIIRPASISTNTQVDITGVELIRRTDTSV